MSSDVPVVHQERWLGYLPLVILYVAILIPLAARNVWHPEAVAFGVVLSLRLILWKVVGWSHRRGMSLVKKERWADAVPCFERSYEFFTKHRWVDRWRALTMLSASKMEYRELALVNLAFCHAQLGESAVARTYYRLALTEYPQNKMARMALRLMGDRDDAHSPVPADARLASLLDRRM